MRIQQATFVKSAAGLADLPRDARPHVIFLGRSNVGKSSLLNALTGHKGLAHVSRTPGRTQLINLFDADGKFYLVDLPGYGYAKIPKPLQAEIAERISDYVHGSDRIRLAILICDAKVGPTADDLATRDLLDDAGLPYLVVANKWDALNMSGKAQATKRFTAAFPEHEVVPHSTLSGEGRDRLLGKIGEALAR